MLVTITKTFDDGTRRWFSGENPDVPKEVALRWISDGVASADTDNASQSWLTSTELAAVREQLVGVTWASVPLTASSTAKRIALGTAVTARLTAGVAGTIAHKFVDGSAAISVTTSNTNSALSATATDLTVPAGQPYLEYIRVGGSDVSFTLTLLR